MFMLSWFILDDPGHSEFEVAHADYIAFLENARFIGFQWNFIDERPIGATEIGD